MAIRFGGEFQVGKKRAEVYELLTDPKRFAPLLPDFESMSQQDERRSTVNLKVGISHIRGTASIQLELAEADKPCHAVYQGKGSVAGGSVILTARFDLEDAGNGTRVIWKGEAQLFGRLISVAGGLLEPLAKKNVQKLIDALQAALS